MGEIETNSPSWESWFQGAASTALDKYTSATWVQPYELQKLKIQALGELGAYQEGTPSGPSQNGTIGGISPGVLLLGGAALLAVLLLKD